MLLNIVLLFNLCFNLINKCAGQVEDPGCCCPDHWIKENDMCYKISQEPATYEDACHDCENNGGALLQTSSPHGYAFALHYGRPPPEWMWLGLVSVAQAQWKDGTNVDNNILTTTTAPLPTGSRSEANETTEQLPTLEPMAQTNIPTNMPTDCMRCGAFSREICLSTGGKSILHAMFDCQEMRPYVCQIKCGAQNDIASTESSNIMDSTIAFLSTASATAGSKTTASLTPTPTIMESLTTASSTNVSLPTAASTIASPITGAQTTSSPNTGAPTISLPITGAPIVGSPTTPSPNTGAPTTASPNTGAPTTASPNTGAPTTASPNDGAPTNASLATTAATTSPPTTASLTTATMTIAAPTAAGCNISSAVQKKIVTRHNRLRSKGNAKFVWSDALATIAKNWAVERATINCILSHGDLATRSTVDGVRPGENGYSSSINTTCTDKKLKALGRAATDAWYSDAKSGGNINVKVTVDDTVQIIFGHSNPVVQGKGKKNQVGCGLAKCLHGGIQFYCNYLPP